VDVLAGPNGAVDRNHFVMSLIVREPPNGNGHSYRPTALRRAGLHSDRVNRVPVRRLEGDLLGFSGEYLVSKAGGVGDREEHEQ